MMMTMMIMIITIIFSRIHALPPCLITCDITLHKYTIITVERSAADSCSQMLAFFGFSPEQVFINSSEQIFMK
jgi:hypothetical protein